MKRTGFLLKRTLPESDILGYVTKSEGVVTGRVSRHMGRLQQHRYHLGTGTAVGRNTPVHKSWGKTLWETKIGGGRSNMQPSFPHLHHGARKLYGQCLADRHRKGKDTTPRNSKPLIRTIHRETTIGGSPITDAIPPLTTEKTLRPGGGKIISVRSVHGTGGFG